VFSPKMAVLLFAACCALCAPAGAGSPDSWFVEGRKAVEAAERLPLREGRARNVILFVGDGMGVSTVTAARILEGQMRGEPGEEILLSFERLPFVALAKTYETNTQTPDSAGTMTAMVTGSKTREGLLALSQVAVRGDHATVPGHRLATILEIAEMKGLSTGVVTTTRLTHATPAACYAHSPERHWESDAALPPGAREAGFPDIARQLIEFPVGDGLEVAMGGGRRHFLPVETADPEDPGATGSRTDGRDLTREWLERFPNAAYVWNQGAFDNVDPAEVDHLLGLFEPSHMEFEHDRPGDASGEPSLTEMTAKAIQILSRNEKGYFLAVEGGRIDHAHHACNAYRALTDTIEMARAVQTALDRVDLERTLVIVTADHSHVLTMGARSARGNDILGLVRLNDPRGKPMEGHALDATGRPYTTLLYANGPGYTGASALQAEGPKTFPHWGSGFKGITRGRPDLAGVETAGPGYLQETAVPLGSETHAGEDVAVYADGPQAHLVRGVIEQNVIYHVMAKALGFTTDDYLATRAAID